MGNLPVLHWLLMLAASLGGGLANALAGGGMFLVFPSLLFTGLAPVSANATATFVLFPGAYASAWVYRDKLTHGKWLQTLMVLVSTAGAWLGSELLLHTPEHRFQTLVPYLMLGAVLVFSFAGRLKTLASAHSAQRTYYAPLLIGQLLISIYGGFFGAGQGVLMLALFLLTANIDIHEASGLRLMCGALSNTVATLVFAVQGIINWKVGIPMILASCAGGYFGAQWIKKLDPNRARLCVLVFAWTISIWLLVRDHL